MHYQDVGQIVIFMKACKIGDEGKSVWEEERIEHIIDFNPPHQQIIEK